MWEANIQTLILIALWCGQPINSTKGAMGFKTGSDISPQYINACREELIRCVASKDGWPKQLDCIKDKKLP